MESLPRFDADGYAVPVYDVLHDQLAECELLDPEAGEPESWLAWTDANRWELGPAIPGDAVLVPDDGDFEELAPELFDPADADLKWAAEVFNLPPVRGGAHGPTAEDWREYHAWSEALDNRLTDEDVRVATGSVG